jgi:hypothetical protein
MGMTYCCQREGKTEETREEMYQITNNVEGIEKYFFCNIQGSSTVGSGK